MRFPRQLETDGSAEMVRRVLMARTAKMWAASEVEVPVITVTETLKAALRKARLRGRIRCGTDPIFEKLAGEKKGIAQVRSQSKTAYGDRISRLLLFSNDGAERFYRNIEQAIKANTPRLLGCFLDIDGSALGQLITGREGIIKIVMAEHKGSVADILRTIGDSSREELEQL
jgi:hypothetical protein